MEAKEPSLSDWDALCGNFIVTGNNQPYAIRTRANLDAETV